MPVPNLKATELSTVRLDVPVAFQLTRTRLLGPGATTMTESFRETWTLEVLPGGLLNLKSPRTTVPAFYASPHGATVTIPRSVLVSERDFARLVGVQPEGQAEPEDGEPAVAPPVGTPISLSLGRASRGGTDVNLNWSEEEHYAVHIEVGANPAF
jgi:hypothetical protein